MSSVTWHCLHHRELDTATLYELLALRTQVFVVEQNCPYLETDGQDLIGDTCHLLARDKSGLVGYLRLLDAVLRRLLENRDEAPRRRRHRAA